MFSPVQNSERLIAFLVCLTSVVFLVVFGAALAANGVVFIHGPIVKSPRWQRKLPLLCWERRSDEAVNGASFIVFQQSLHIGVHRLPVVLRRFYVCLCLFLVCLDDLGQYYFRSPVLTRFHCFCAARDGMRRGGRWKLAGFFIAGHQVAVSQDVFCAMFREGSRLHQQNGLPCPRYIMLVR